MVKDATKVPLDKRRGNKYGSVAAGELSEIVNRFRRRHVKDVLDVDHYFHDNIFGYDTGHAFFASNEGVRGSRGQQPTLLAELRRLSFGGGNGKP